MENLDAMISIHLIQLDINVCTKKINYFTHHLSRTRDDKSKSKVLALLVCNFHELSKLITIANSVLKKATQTSSL